MEYERYGVGWIRRESTEHEWEPVSEDDIPEEELSRIQELEQRKSLVLLYGMDPRPGQRPVPFAKILNPGDEGYAE
ncbi:MAG: hypothetical protein ACSLE3_07165 [Microbacteriaceae bacterium]